MLTEVSNSLGEVLPKYFLIVGSELSFNVTACLDLVSINLTENKFRISNADKKKEVGG